MEKNKIKSPLELLVLFFNFSQGWHTKKVFLVVEPQRGVEGGALIFTE